jgi:hypothetical protein
MVKKLLVTTASASLLLAAPASAAGWRTALVGSNEDRSQFASFFDFNRTTLAKVNALRVRLSSSMTTKLTAEVKCDRGEASGSRKVNFSQTAGVRIRALPVPLRGGVCTIELDVSASDSGRYDLLLQYQ